MRKILIVQRSLTHYRKLLFSYLSSQGDMKIDVCCMGDTNKIDDNVYIFAQKTLRLKFAGKDYQLSYSNGIKKYIKDHYNEYDYIIMEGATNIINNILVCNLLKKVGKGYIIWDAGRRKNAKMTLLRRFAQKSLKQIWAGADAIMAYSTLAKEYFVCLGIKSEKVFVCQNTLYVGEFDKQIQNIDEKSIEILRNSFSANNEKLILYVGAIEERKRIKDLIQAYIKLRDQRDDIKLLIIGGGNQLLELQNYVANNNINGVELLGPIIDGVIKYFLATDIFVLPSEGGLSLNQAMICSKALVASSADGTELDLIEDGKNGYIFEEANIDQLTEKIKSILSDEEKIKSMGLYSRLIIDTKVNEKIFLENLDRCLEYVSRKRNELLKTGVRQ